MKRVLLSLMVLASLANSQESISERDLAGAVLIDGRDTMQLDRGQYKDTSDQDADYYQVNFHNGLTRISEDKKSAAVTIMLCAGGFGQGRTYLIGYAVKNHGVTCIRVGDAYGDSKTEVKSISYNDSFIKILLYESYQDTPKVYKQKKFKIVNDTPVLTF